MIHNRHMYLMIALYYLFRIYNKYIGIYFIYNKNHFKFIIMIVSTNCFACIGNMFDKGKTL